eukprot:496781-Amphidinium_carterae.1
MSNAHSTVQTKTQTSPTQVHDTAISNRVVELCMASLCSAWAKPPGTQCPHFLACEDLLRLALWIGLADLDCGQDLAAMSCLVRVCLLQMQKSLQSVSHHCANYIYSCG